MRVQEVKVQEIVQAAFDLVGNSAGVFALLKLRFVLAYGSLVYLRKVHTVFRTSIRTAVNFRAV